MNWLISSTTYLQVVIESWGDASEMRSEPGHRHRNGSSRGIQRPGGLWGSVRVLCGHGDGSLVPDASVLGSGHGQVFVNRDPIGYTGGANLHGFADGNPVNEIDPDGTDATGDKILAIARTEADSSHWVDKTPDNLTGTGIGCSGFVFDCAKNAGFRLHIKKSS
jgi:hypothetical protein